MRLRDLLKFDFYFADSAAFREHIAEEMAWQRTGSQVREGGIDTLLLQDGRWCRGHAASFFEGYEIVADVLRKAPAEIGEKELTKLAMGVGRQYIAQNGCSAANRYRRCCSPPHGRLPRIKSSPLVRKPRRTSPSIHTELQTILPDVDHVDKVARRQFAARGLRSPKTSTAACCREPALRGVDLRPRRYDPTVNGYRPLAKEVGFRW